MTDKRIIDLQEISEVADGTYVMTDHSTIGTRKYDLRDVIDSGSDAADAAESANAAAQEASEAIETLDELIDAVSDMSELNVPLMSDSTRGGAKLGSGLAVEDGALSAVSYYTTEESGGDTVLTLVYDLVTE